MADVYNNNRKKVGKSYVPLKEYQRKDFISRMIANIKSEDPAFVIIGVSMVIGFIGGTTQLVYNISQSYDNFPKKVDSTKVLQNIINYYPKDRQHN